MEKTTGKRTTVKKDKGTTIWLTRKEYALVAESRELFAAFSGAKISWGAYLCALSLGALTAKAISGVLIRCPDCGHEVEMKMVNPRSVPRRKNRQSRETVVK
jgi:DNA-directed RNA polymerase subunit RPC12/RpoP